MRMDFTLESVRATRQRCEKMSVWTRVLSFIELMEEEEEDGEFFMEKE